MYVLPLLLDPCLLCLSYACPSFGDDDIPHFCACICGHFVSFKLHFVSVFEFQRLAVTSDAHSQGDNRIGPSLLSFRH